MLQNKTKLIQSLALLLVAFSTFYYFVIFLPQKERNRQEQILKEEARKTQEAAQEAENTNAKSLLLSECLRVASNRYSQNLEANCLDKPTYNPDGSIKCVINPDVIKNMQNIYEQEQNSCYKKYK